MINSKFLIFIINCFVIVINMLSITSPTHREQRKSICEGRLFWGTDENGWRDTAKTVRHLSMPGTITSISSITQPETFSPSPFGKNEQRGAEFPHLKGKVSAGPLALVAIASGGAVTRTHTFTIFQDWRAHRVPFYRGNVGQEL